MTCVVVQLAALSLGLGSRPTVELASRASCRRHRRFFSCPRGGKPANSAGSDPGMGGYRANRYPSRYPPTINEGLIPGTRYPPASIYLTMPATRYLPATKRYWVAKPGGGSTCDLRRAHRRTADAAAARGGRRRRHAVTAPFQRAAALLMHAPY